MLGKDRREEWGKREDNGAGRWEKEAQVEESCERIGKKKEDPGGEGEARGGGGEGAFTQMGGVLGEEVSGPGGTRSRGMLRG